MYVPPASDAWPTHCHCIQTLQAPQRGAFALMLNFYPRHELGTNSQPGAAAAVAQKPRAVSAPHCDTMYPASFGVTRRGSASTGKGIAAACAVVLTCATMARASNRVSALVILGGVATRVATARICKGSWTRNLGP